LIYLHSQKRAGTLNSRYFVNVKLLAVIRKGGSENIYNALNNDRPKTTTECGIFKIFGQHVKK
jgi:hypothetical protein